MSKVKKSIYFRSVIGQVFHDFIMFLTFYGDGYSYGFNGMEKDGEVNGGGNIYTAEFWQYDARLGRRWNLDPVDQVNQSNYTTLNNNPNRYVDPLGSKFRGTISGMFKLVGYRIKLTIRSWKLNYQLARAYSDMNLGRVVSLTALKQANNDDIQAFKKLKKSKTTFFISNKKKEISDNNLSFDAKIDQRRNKKHKRVVLMYDPEKEEGG